MPPSQRVMVRRVTRSSPDSDDTLPGDESEEYRDDTFLVSSNNENNYYPVGAGSRAAITACSRFFAALSRQLQSMSYLCPGLFPWVDCGPATDHSGMFVIKSVGIMYLLIIIFDCSRVWKPWYLDLYQPVGAGSSGSNTACSRFFAALSRQLQSMSYLCPGLFPWVDCGPATDHSGMFVIKSVGIMYLLIIIFDLFAAYGSPGTSTFTNVSMILLMLAIFGILLIISRKPQNRVALIYTTPGLPFVPTIAIIVNIYLILNLSILTLVRFTLWMILGMFMYFKYGIKNSTLETNPPGPPPETPPPPNPLDRTTIPPPSPHTSRHTGDRNIFEGDGNEGLYGNMEYNHSLLTWHESNLQPVSSRGSTPSSSNTYNPTTYRQVETRYDVRTNTTTTHTSSISRPPWANPEALFGNWDDDN
uniref:Cationic amino acid transporter C-terminal domain-containing protein n=1 Tax=Heliothis virescens TaxID=7102 RepID=A0A2A4JIX6_HELVI